MEFQDLHCFVAVAETLHFGRAAERLHITQPALTRRIQALEAELFVQLFERTKRRVQLTIAGQTFYTEVKQILHQT
jgi:DNA-binding transcriptional LysR family regulator